jgi:hypothetical protein
VGEGEAQETFFVFDGVRFRQLDPFNYRHWRG